MNARLSFASLALLTGFAAVAAEPSHVTSLSFNGVHLGDVVGKIKEKTRTGQCYGKGKMLTECTIFDSSGVAYDINDGYVVRVEARRGVTTDAKLPFGIKIGASFEETLKRSFPLEGGRAFVRPEKTGVTLIRMIREPRTEYEFELQLRFDREGNLEGVVYKDII
jgi:hypothetical protein